MHARKFGRASLDLDALVRSGAIEPAQAARLAELSGASVAVTILSSAFAILGSLGIAIGVVLLQPSATVGLLLALAALGLGGVLVRSNRAEVNVAGMSLAICGALGLSGWIGLEWGDAWDSRAVTGAMTGVVLGVALRFRSRFLAALVPFGVAAMLGSGTFYWHAVYAVVVREAAVTGIVFTTLAILLGALAARAGALDEAWEAMARVASRAALVIANVGLWVGSLWGDHVGEHLFGVYDRAREAGDWAALRAWREQAFHIPDTAFVLAWAAASIVAIAVGMRRGDRFTANSGVVFLAINAYTQFFERLKDTEWALIGGGVALVAVAVALIRFPLIAAPPARTA